MVRVLPDDVIQAYIHTGLIPIRCAWHASNPRGGCAIEALATHRGVDVQELRAALPGRYEEGFVLAWDSDNPRHSDIIEAIRSDDDDSVKRGFCDGILCRSAVEKTFSTEGVMPVSNDS